ncbi:6-phospho-3-hexuloisomerase [Bifidobacterium sp. ESL0690]|uniref:6-phospho-3-hexuloisomerase n=1 Tax=Bifidobacterium sp. ESL0690 TaxID=2983214 RepID=UPI0023FA153C|nr:6-phospho-3-hexuloisomerase [Bifidobacterium sp. ESL0690]WEV46881.1 6-phospho-3-hexuloisomerase [Bifidobacterium sp. ESL0690]
MNKELELIVGEINKYYVRIDDESLHSLARAILTAKRVFVAGLGRSGDAAQAFSNRLMHLGLQVHFVGESTSPSIAKNDLLVICSGSGTTTVLLAMARKCKEIGAKVATLTMAPQAAIGELSDFVVRIPGSAKRPDSHDGTADSRQPMGTLFEQFSWLTFDALVLILMSKLGETTETMFARHTNLE